MSDGMGREPAYLSSHATNRYFIPNWGNYAILCKQKKFVNMFVCVFETLGLVASAQLLHVVRL